MTERPSSSSTFTPPLDEWCWRTTLLRSGLPSALAESGRGSTWACARGDWPAGHLRYGSLSGREAGTASEPSTDGEVARISRTAKRRTGGNLNRYRRRGGRRFSKLLPGGGSRPCRYRRPRPIAGQKLDGETRLLGPRESLPPVWKVGFWRTCVCIDVAAWCTSVPTKTRPPVHSPYSIPQHSG